MSEVIVELRDLKNGKVFKVQKADVLEDKDNLYTVINNIRKTVYIDKVTNAYYVRTVE